MCGERADVHPARAKRKRTRSGEVRARCGARGVFMGPSPRAREANEAWGRAAVVEVGGGAGKAACSAERRGSSGPAAQRRASGREPAARVERPGERSASAHPSGDGGAGKSTSECASRRAEDDPMRSEEEDKKSGQRARKKRGKEGQGHHVTPQLRLHGLTTARSRDADT